MSANVPDDIIITIFEQVVPTQLEEWPGAQYDKQRALAPFILAAVCRRWRFLAHGMATLWTYFAFPSDPVHLAGHSERLRLLLRLSRDALIDGIFVWGSPYNYQDGEDSSSVTEEVMKALSSIVKRWRNIRLRLSSSATEHLREALEGTAPNLTSLSVVTDLVTYFLPNSPRLKRLYMECTFMKVPTTLNQAFPALTHVALISDPFSRFTHEFSIQYSATITELTILDNLPDDVLPEPIQLPVLESLILEDPEYLRCFNAPRIQQLALGDGIDRHPRVAVLSELYSSVTELTLFGAVDGASMSELRSLVNVKTLRFAVPPTIQICFERHREYSITVGTFEAMESGLPFVLPLLERIVFEAPLNGDIAELDATDLLNFVQARNAPADERVDLRVSRILDVLVDPKIKGVTPELITALSRLSP